MFDECTLRNVRFAPARFCAPMAGYTHSAFRRLLAEFGGCGALWTEMLAGRQILSEDFARSPWLRRRPEEGRVIYQLMVRAGDPLERILDRLREEGVDAVDINLACDAMSIRACEAGSALFENLQALQRVLGEVRRHWHGLFVVKIRLGARRPDWEPRFLERLRAIEAAGVDAVTVHPRFFEDKFRRRARHDLIAWVGSQTCLAVIANGDLRGGSHVRALADQLAAASAVMLGRMAVVQPWVFAAWDRPVAVDVVGTWRQACRYLAEDFPPALALRRIQLFAKYYAANFVFGHRLRVELAKALTFEQALDVAEAFFERAPQVLPEPRTPGL